MRKLNKKALKPIDGFSRFLTDGEGVYMLPSYRKLNIGVDGCFDLLPDGEKFKSVKVKRDEALNGCKKKEASNAGNKDQRKKSSGTTRKRR